MPYRYLEDVATADVAFEAWGSSPEEMLTAAAEATLNVMVTEPAAVAPHQQRSVVLEAPSIEMVLFQLLQEIIYYKDAQQLLLRVDELSVENEAGRFRLKARLVGEQIDPQRHELIVDVKAVTLYQFQVVQDGSGWRARVILDV